MFWQVQATVTIYECMPPIDRTQGYSRSFRTHQIPTFFLSDSLHGISDEQHALNIARDILNPSHDPNVVVEGHALLQTREEMADDIERQRLAWEGKRLVGEVSGLAYRV